jgi:hypothetical protein
MSTQQRQQAEHSKKLVARANELEGRVADFSKKYDDSKRQYFKSKEERERLRQEIETLGGNGREPKPDQGTQEVANKYE